MFLSRAALDHDPPAYASRVVEIAGVHHRTQLFDGLVNFLPRLASNYDLPPSYLRL
jgi:hypothetical protein